MAQRILVVDDDAINREILAEMLDDGFDTRYAESGAEALQIAGAFRPDLVLLDIMMPGMDGYETCQQLRAAHPYCKIILVSAKAMTKERLRGYEVGADDYVTKPFDPFELVAKLQVFLRLGHVEELDRRKADLLTILAHEMRTPLTMILTTAQLLDDSAGQIRPADATAMNRVILEGGQRLNALIEKTVKLFEVGFGKPTLPEQQIDLGDILRRATPALAEPTVKVCWNVEGPLCVFGLERELHEAFSTLMRRALVQPGVVHVDARPDSDGVQVTISVDGATLDAEQVRLWFSPFEVADVQHHSEPLDLDLPIAAAILRRHGGGVEAALDGGRLTFLASLPRPRQEDCGCRAA